MKKKIFMIIAIAIISLFPVVKTVSAVSNENISIVVNGTTLVTKNDTNNYYVKTGYNVTEVYLRVNGDNIVVSGEGVIPLTEQKTTHTFTVSDENETKTYTLTVIKADKTLEDAKREQKKKINDIIFNIKLYFFTFVIIFTIYSIVYGIRVGIKYLIRKIKKSS